MKILVTGASGFVGSAIATALSAEGHRVIGTGRSTPGWIAPPGSSYVYWDLFSEPPKVSPDAVVHCAALVSDQMALAAALRANRDGTLAVRRSFPDAQMIHISSSSVYDSFRSHHFTPESEGPGRNLAGAYARSKASAELVLGPFPETVILRPHAVYGPGDRTLLPRIEAALRGNVLLLPNGGRARHSLTHIDNLIAAVRCALFGSVSGSFNITDAEPVQLAEAMIDLLARRRRRITVRSVPYRLAQGLGGAAEAMGAILGPREGSLSRYAVAQLAFEHSYQLSAAKQQLGYRPKPTSFLGAEHW
ncbi:nucleoside-diphosphate-sugar epimerase [Psychromicrobium silvestre]|uniref:Nucleoside-diphosphate-sugar epimerase n=1 Tax=Psychromicrobium silvestre TaxID=1645614 RepID=A0A7Y9LS19_9MICC|nr:NAD(P)-dependent oxidoreductase [Psychromicrobium silvestre]NYE94532.1 nucleoside-diphosphate-sugar epimerase [Psychromicrobium silvestre]